MRHLIGAAIQFYEGLALHLQLHLRVLLEDYGAAVTGTAANLEAKASENSPHYYGGTKSGNSHGARKKSEGKSMRGSPDSDGVIAIVCDATLVEKR